jgi:hypothetical protein
MKAFMSDRQSDGNYWRGGRGTIPQWDLQAQALREAERIERETEHPPVDRADVDRCRFADLRFFKRKARKDADTRSLFTEQFKAHDCLADALREFIES